MVHGGEAVLHCGSSWAQLAPWVWLTSLCPTRPLPGCMTLPTCSVLTQFWDAPQSERGVIGDGLNDSLETEANLGDSMCKDL